MDLTRRSLPHRLLLPTYARAHAPHFQCSTFSFMLCSCFVWSNQLSTKFRELGIAFIPTIFRYVSLRSILATRHPTTSAYRRRTLRVSDLLLATSATQGALMPMGAMSPSTVEPNEEEDGEPPVTSSSEDASRVGMVMCILGTFVALLEVFRIAC